MTCQDIPVSLLQLPSMPDYRKWKYNNDVLEYFVETSTKQTIKHSELLKRVETTQAADAQLHSEVA